ncbi:hypothetical protein GQ53DRAFT_672715 [Thozetella sp. PMI_491]|nr:hypothetical protein GQ53DRAFT_672715 [Thozetella sp. PMI_491]
MAEKMSIDTEDPTRHDQSDGESLGSSPEGEAPSTTTPQENQQPKRKGGRKPIYATSEERKQRNRQAQAAFRERRTEYIKQLEEAIRTHEQNLANLQAAHRNAADECLMLRYKNSLLERILLEKGIDVQAELRAKTGSPTLGPTHLPQPLVQPPTYPRALLNRHHSRRSNSSIAPKLEPGAISPIPPPGSAHPSAASPKTGTTPSSHSASPGATTSYGSQHGASPASSDQVTPHVRRANIPPGSMKAPPPPHAAPLPPLAAQRRMQMSGLQHSTAQARGHPASPAAPFYQSPAYQNHIEQLEQEYDAAADLMDESGEAPDTPNAPGQYPTFGEQPHLSLSSPVTTGAPATGHHVAGLQAMDSAAQSHGGAYPSMTQLLDPRYDFDPFGLSASMAFPTSFSFDTSNMR